MPSPLSPEEVRRLTAKYRPTPTATSSPQSPRETLRKWEREYLRGVKSPYRQMARAYFRGEPISSLRAKHPSAKLFLERLEARWLAARPAPVVSTPEGLVFNRKKGVLQSATL